MLLGTLVAGLPVSLAAQETFVWSDIDCAQSKLVIPAGLKCKETNTAGTRNAAKSTGGGLTKRWSAFGTLQGAKLYYYVHDDFDGKSWVQVGQLTSEIQNISAQAKGATIVSGPEKRGDADFITFTSSSTVKNFMEASPNGIPEGAKVVSIGPITSEAAREAGLTVDIEAERHDIAGLVDALLIASAG